MKEITLFSFNFKNKQLFNKGLKLRKNSKNDRAENFEDSNNINI